MADGNQKLHAEEARTGRRLVAFRSRLRPGVEGEYGPRAEEMLALARSMRGFQWSRHYVAEDGERLTLVQFESAQALAAWRDHPEHRKAQAQGRERWYAEYTVSVCEVLRESRFEST